MLILIQAPLDLLEGALHEQGIGTARFDGDVAAEQRTKVLDNFKVDQDLKVLLMSVSSGGTGLNIVCANHVLFLDRWFNPTVHDQVAALHLQLSPPETPLPQAMDRAHRLGQKKPVQVQFFDSRCTLDEVVSHSTVCSCTTSIPLCFSGT